jgi:dihydrofolate synthase / folylpolyglutamate synthase
VTRDRVVERLRDLEQFGIKLGLDNIRTLAAALGNPHDTFRSIHVAGTNGKGSVTAMVERGLRAAGHRTGRYTSPHLTDIEERIAIDGAAVSRDRFAQVAADVLDTVDRLRGTGALQTVPTFFEVTTAIGFEIFRLAGVDTAVIEVGLGGRFDATNIITPAVGAITSIAFDHERHLGNSIASIAYEKAGVLKRERPFVIGDVPDEAREVIESVAKDTSARLVDGSTRLVDALSVERGRSTVTVATPMRRYEDLRLALHGAHQVANAVIAIRVLESVATAGIDIAADDIAVGVTDAEWPARLEWLQTSEGGAVLLDAAHNPAGAKSLAAYLAQSGVAPLPVVLAIMADKNVAQIVRAIAPYAAEFLATTVESTRALTPDELATAILAAAPSATVARYGNALDAVNAARSRSRALVVAGSIYLVGPIRAQLLAAGARRLAEAP